ncbi:hypothetical protein DFH29DRAFT_225678 [Suillus ampliporus]|nr:hypothetical protein DFH29DRAFT_225678 [Suillus ampliporus]
MQINMSNSTSQSPSIPRPSPLGLYHALWRQQDHSVVKRGLKCNVFELEDRRRHPFTYDTVDLSGHPGVKLSSGATRMLIRPVYDILFRKMSTTKRNFVVHGPAGIGKTHFLAYVLVRRLLARQPVTYQVDEPDSCVLCFTADGFFTLPQENSEHHPLFKSTDVLHLVEGTHGDFIAHPNTDHTRALMRGRCGKAVFTKFRPASQGFDAELLPEDGVALQQWMHPCTFDEISVMSAITGAPSLLNAESLRWIYIHFGPNAHVCLKVSQNTSDASLSREDYLSDFEQLERDNLWCLNPTLHELQARFSHAVMLLADNKASNSSGAAKATVDILLNAEGPKEPGEIFYRQAVVTLMSRFGGTFELSTPNLWGHFQPAHEVLVLGTKINVARNLKQAMPSRYPYCTQRDLVMLAEKCPNILHSPKDALVHPGIDAIMFDASTSTVWLMQVTHGSPRPVSPEGLLFLLNAVRGTAYEPSPVHHWQFVFATREQTTGNPFQLSGERKTRYFSSLFWELRVKSYIMQLRDTPRGLFSSDPYEPWGFHCKKTSLSRRLANSLAHHVQRPRRATKSETKSEGALQDQSKAASLGALIRTSGVPGAQLLGDMTVEQSVVPNGVHVNVQTNN